MTDSPNHDKLQSAIADQDIERIRAWILDQEFVLINVRTGEEEDEEDAVGVLTAEIEGEDVWVAFSSEPLAGEFVEAMPDMFEQNEEIEGYVVDGDALLEYIPEDVGLLLDPESDNTFVLPKNLLNDIVALEGEE